MMSTCLSYADGVPAAAVAAPQACLGGEGEGSEPGSLKLKEALEAGSGAGAGEEDSASQTAPD